jgi:DDE domain
MFARLAWQILAHGTMKPVPEAAFPNHEAHRLDNIKARLFVLEKALVHTARTQRSPWQISRTIELTGLPNMDELFKGRHFDREIIVLCVRWYLRYKLSFRDLVEMMAERGLSLAHTTIMRWIQRYVPDFEKRWNRFARPAGRSWRVDETYVKIKGRWTCLYRAVDKEGKTVAVRHSRCDYTGELTSPKSNRVRHIPMDVDVYEVLLSRRQSTGYVFLDRDGRPFDDKRLQRRIAAGCRQAGLRKIGWHTLRHYVSFLTISSNSEAPADLIGNVGSSCAQVLPVTQHSFARIQESNWRVS